MAWGIAWQNMRTQVRLLALGMRRREKLCEFSWRLIHCFPRAQGLAGCEGWGTPKYLWNFQDWELRLGVNTEIWKSGGRPGVMGEDEI